MVFWGRVKIREHVEEPRQRLGIRSAQASLIRIAFSEIRDGCGMGIITRNGYRYAVVSTFPDGSIRVRRSDGALGSLRPSDSVKLVPSPR